MFFLCLIVFSRRGASAAEMLWTFSPGAALYALGLAGRVWSSGFLVKNDALTTTGPYGYVRNPIYVSNLLLGASLILMSGLYWTALLLVLLYAACYVPGMRVEEENLRRRFGDAFDRYARSVPLIAPRARSGAGYGGGRWAAAAYRENREVWVTAGLLIGMAVVIWRRLGAAV